MYREHDFSDRTPITDAHTSPETALLIEDYPYGFRERTQIRYWLEYKSGHGFRQMAQTLNPKTGRWNKPKASTYVPVMVLARQESTGHVVTHSIGNYDEPTAIDAYETFYAGALTDNHRKEIRLLRALNAAQKYITVTVRQAEPGEDYAATQAENQRHWRAALAQGFRDTAN